MLKKILQLLSTTKIPIDEAPVSSEEYFSNLITQNSSEVSVNNKKKGISEITYPKQKVQIYVLSEEADQLDESMVESEIKKNLCHLITITKAVSENGLVWIFLAFADYVDTTQKQAIEFKSIDTYAIEFMQKKQISWNNHLTKLHYQKRNLQLGYSAVLENNAKKRITQEITTFRSIIDKKLQQDTLNDVIYYIYPDQQKKNTYNVHLKGTKNTVYQYFAFVLEVTLPNYYPYKAPTIKFLSKVYHPNVNLDTGDISIDLLKSAYVPELSIENLILGICSLFDKPDVGNMNEIFNNEAFQLMKTNKKKFEEQVYFYGQQEPTVILETPPLDPINVKNE